MFRSRSLLRRGRRPLTSRGSSASSVQCAANYLEIIHHHSKSQNFIPPIYTRRNFSTDDSSKSVQKNQDSYERAIAELPEGAQIHLDFFGEPVTFFGVKGTDNIPNAVASLDGFVIGAASKGKSFTGGGEEEGLSIQSAHSAALAWSELLRHAAIWNRSTAVKSAPMLAYVAVVPMLAKTGIGYMKYVDHLLGQVESGVEGVPPIQIVELAENAAAMKVHEDELSL